MVKSEVSIMPLLGDLVLEYEHSWQGPRISLFLDARRVVYTWKVRNGCWIIRNFLVCSLEWNLSQLNAKYAYTELHTRKHETGWSPSKNCSIIREDTLTCFQNYLWKMARYESKTLCSKNKILLSRSMIRMRRVYTEIQFFTKVSFELNFGYL